MMLRAFQYIAESHDLGLLALATVICVLATSASARLLCCRRAVMRDQPVVCLCSAILAYGTGVWTTHFISILAYRPGIAFDLDLPLVALSLLLAMVGTSFAFMPGPRPGLLFHDSHWDAVATIVIRGLILATGIGAMHFVGMQAIRMPGGLHYQTSLVVVSLATGAFSAIAAMWLLASRRPGLASIFLLLAVASTHFIAMGALATHAAPSPNAQPAGLSQLTLAISISGICLLILTLAITATILSQHHTTRIAREARRSGPSPTQPSKASSSSAPAPSSTSTARCAGWPKATPAP